MLVIVGLIVVTGSVLGGFVMAGGHVGALVQPSELVTIGGASLGALIVMSPKKVLIDLLHGLLQCIKGTPYNKAGYEELFKMLYDVLRFVRREGLAALESHLLNAHESSIFTQYPHIAHNHHVMGFICGAFLPVVEGTVRPEQLSPLLKTEIGVIEEEHHAPIGALTKTADALPGFGIVAAVLGIVITMAAIDGPVEEIGHHVGAALVGTFLGILASYGYIAPLVVRMESLGAAELAFFRTITVVIQGFASDLPPKIAVEIARRGVSSEFRPTRDRLDELFADVDSPS
jgi:chemotaxis protein MotA